MVCEKKSHSYMVESLQSSVEHRIWLKFTDREDAKNLDSIIFN